MIKSWIILSCLIVSACVVFGQEFESTTGEIPTSESSITTEEESICGAGTIWDPIAQQCVADVGTTLPPLDPTPEVVSYSHNLFVKAPGGDITLMNQFGGINLNQLQTMMQEFTTLQQTVSDQGMEIKELQNVVDTLVDQGKVQGQKISDLESDLSQAKTDISNLDSRVQQLETFKSNVLSSSCSGQQIVSFDSEGNAECEDEKLYVPDFKVVQKRLSKNCPTGSSIRVINEDGSVECEDDSHTVTVGKCQDGQVVVEIEANGNVICKDAVSTLDKNRVQMRPTSGSISCSSGQYLYGVSVDGVPSCRTDIKPSGSCATNSYVTGVDASGKFSCTAHNDNVWQRRITNTCGTNQYMITAAKTGAVACRAATSGISKACPSGQVVTSISGTTVQCAADQKGGTQASGSCYVRWGQWGCATGYSFVMKGYSGGFENFGSGGDFRGNTVCISSASSVRERWTGGYANRMMRADSDSNGMDQIGNHCSVCCTGGCFTAYGTNSCPSGFSRKYAGRIGGVEAYNGARHHGQTLCLDTSSTTTSRWSNGYSTRLMRHRSNGSGMESVVNSCAVCCKD